MPDPGHLPRVQDSAAGKYVYTNISRCKCVLPFVAPGGIQTHIGIWAGPVCLPRLLRAGGGGAAALSDRLLAETGVMLVASTLFPGMEGDDRVRFGLGRGDVEGVLSRLGRFLG